MIKWQKIIEEGPAGEEVFGYLAVLEPNPVDGGDTIYLYCRDMSQSPVMIYGSELNNYTVVEPSKPVEETPEEVPAPPVLPEETEPEVTDTLLPVVQEGKLVSSFLNYSWDTDVELEASLEFVKDGNSTLISAVYSDIDTWEAFNAYRETPLALKDFKGIELCLAPEEDIPANSLQLVLANNRTPIVTLPLPELKKLDVDTVIQLSFEDLELSNAEFTNIWIQGAANAQRPPLWIISIDLVLADFQPEETETLEPESSWNHGIVLSAPSPFLFTTEGNKIFRANWVIEGMHGVNLHCTRGNNACAYSQPNVDEIVRRLEELAKHNIQIVRLCMESYSSATEGSSYPRTHWKSPIVDPDYWDDVKRILNVCYDLSITPILCPWVDPSYTREEGEVTDQLIELWRFMASDLKNSGHIMFGILNEPTNNWNGSLNQSRREGFINCIKAIREVEFQEHIILVQGIGGWARNINYWAENPLPFSNIAYEVHIYNDSQSAPGLYQEAAKQIPVIVGEYGPSHGGTLESCVELQNYCRANGIPHLAWAYHPASAPSMLANTNGNCGIGMNLNNLTPWGRTVLYI